MRTRYRVRGAVIAGLAASTLLVGFVAPNAGAVASHSGGTVTWAEGAGAGPNYIFPYMSCSYFSVANINQFQFLMYRPLFWFGLGASTLQQPALSPATVSPTTGSGASVFTIKLKGWKFSNGTVINAKSVMFFLNMLKAIPGDYCGYNQNVGIPDQIKSVSVSNSGAGSIKITMTQKVSPSWLLYNYLSFLTPMPEIWDRTSSGASHCSSDVYGSATAKTQCTAVYNYLNGQATDPSKWANSFWQGAVSGPWKLQSTNGSGTAIGAVFVPNTKYSGPQKPVISKFIEKAYASETAELNDLKANTLQFGYIDPTDVTSPAPTPGGTGPNLSSLNAHYKLVGGFGWQFNYNELNWNHTGGKFLKQLYIRQALQDGINQPGMAASVYQNYATVTCSALPPNQILPTAMSGKPTCQDTGGVNAGKTLLTNHGWQIQGGTQTCIRPGTAANDCGQGINNGDKLSLSFEFLSQATAAASYQTDEDQINNWNSEGIAITPNPTNFDTGIGDCLNFDMCNWGGGWLFAPDYYPSGETLFEPGGGFNLGAVSIPVLTTDIIRTDYGWAGHTAKQAMTQYAQDAASLLPVNYVPTPTGIGEIQRTVTFVNSTAGQPNPLADLMPEYIKTP